MALTKEYGKGYNTALVTVTKRFYGAPHFIAAGVPVHAVFNRLDAPNYPDEWVAEDFGLSAEELAEARRLLPLWLDDKPGDEW